VTVGAADVGMTPKQSKSRFTGVLELLRVPVSSGMTVATLLSLVTFVNVIGCVATDTCRGYVLVFFAGMTGQAGCLHMFAGQRKGRRVMVEVRFLPGLCVVAGSAVRPQRTLVGILLCMTATTHGRRLTIGNPCRVTALAGRSDVGIVEREVREVVSECNLAESRDIGIAAQVLGVASAALTPGGLPHATVITAPGANIFDDFFVAAQTLGALPLTIGEVVAVRAFGLDPGVRLGHWTGHHELLNAGGRGARAEQQHD